MRFSNMKKVATTLLLVLTLVLGLMLSSAFAWTSTAVAQGAIPPPEVPYPLPVMVPNGDILVSIFNGNSWVNAGSIPCDQYLREGDLDLSGLLPATGRYEVCLTQQGGGAAQLDQTLLGGMAPVAVNGVTGGLPVQKLAQRDFDLIDLNQVQELTFPEGGANGTLQIVARIDSVVIDQTPFQFPPADLFHTINANSAFYTYSLDSVKGPLGLSDTDTAPFFKEYCVPVTGHPAGYAYGWVSNDDQNLYAIIDFTPGDTDNDGVDYAKLYAKTGSGVKEFLDASNNPQWGQALFTYTDKVNYQHEVYEIQVPFTAMGITYQSGQQVPIAFAAFGTASAGTLGAPTVTSPISTDITSTAATLGGDVTSDGGASITKRGILYSLTSVNGDPTLGGTGVTEVDDASATTGTFTESVAGLSPGWGYSFVAFATNSAGTAYTSPVSTFTTVGITSTTVSIIDAGTGSAWSGSEVCEAEAYPAATVTGTGVISPDRHGDLLLLQYLHPCLRCHNSCCNPECLPVWRDGSPGEHDQPPVSRHLQLHSRLFGRQQLRCQYIDLRLIHGGQGRYHDHRDRFGEPVGIRPVGDLHGHGVGGGPGVGHPDRHGDLL